MIDQQLLMKNLKRAIDYALNLQNKDGYWMAALDSNSTMEAEFIMLLYFLGSKKTDVLNKLSNHIIMNQQQNGSWSLYFNGPGDLSTTVECYFALMLAGISKEMPHMQRAKTFIRVNGGIAKVRVFTKIWLALFGEWPWSNIPILPPEIIFLPACFPINIYAFASWARATIIPLTIVMAKRPIHLIPPECTLADLVLPNANMSRTGMDFKKGWGTIFALLDKSLHLYNRSPWKPGRKRAIQKIVTWIIDHQEADGSWAGIQPPWVYSLIALQLMDYSVEHPVMQKGISGFDSFAITTHDTMQIQACLSPVWDTGIMINALKEAGLDHAHPALQLGYRWLIKKQIHVGGDWQIKNPNLTPGGWAFEFENNHYPDIDDTAEVLMALWNASLPEPDNTSRKSAIETGMQWLIGMQCENGGWAAFDKDNNSSFLAKLPFFDFGEMLDPPSVDVTAHVVEALGLMGYQRDNSLIKKALQFIYQEQEPDGSWFGRWGVNYIYGTGTVLPALRAVGEDTTMPFIQDAAKWLVAHQNSDGGWGESCASYVDPLQRGQGLSTPTQTAWALIGLMSVDHYQEHPAVQHGINYLCQSLNSAGTWTETEYTGCGFPGYGDGGRRDPCLQTTEQAKESQSAAGFMINYHLYRHYWPLMALGRYLNHWKNK